MKATRKNVLVIGAGVSGLAAAKSFQQHGHQVVIVDRANDLGGVWDPARSYPDVQTQSPKDLYRYTDMAMPADFPEWPKGRQVHQYLGSYADKHNLRPLIRFATDVVAMRRSPGGGWFVELERNGEASSEKFDFVAVCTGQFSALNKPAFPGADAFEAQGGQILHSSQYTDPSLVQGKNVVVLGFSKSATDIAVNAVRSGAKQVSIVYREPMWRIPYFVGGLINFKRILYIRAQEEMFPAWAQTSMQRFNHAIARPLVWGHWRALEALLNLQLGLKKHGMKPKSRIEDNVNCSVPIVTPGFFPLLKQGKIKAYEGTFDAYGDRSVKLTGGQKVDADIAILATGWRQGVPFLAEEDRAKLVDADGQHRLYRNIVNPDLPDLGFVGFNSSFATVLSADLAANWLVRYADGQLVRQPTDDQMRRTIVEMVHWRRHIRPAAGSYGGLCIAPYHFKHFDELIDDIGAKVRRRNPITEKFTPPDASAFGRYLSSAPAYQAA